MLSPSTYRLDRVKKLHVYAREGVAHAWLVHPGERTLEILRLRDGRWEIVATHGGDARLRAEPFEAVTIDLRALARAHASEPQPFSCRSQLSSVSSAQICALRSARAAPWRAITASTASRRRYS